MQPVRNFSEKEGRYKLFVTAPFRHAAIALHKGNPYTVYRITFEADYPNSLVTNSRKGSSKIRREA